MHVILTTIGESLNFPFFSNQNTPCIDGQRGVDDSWVKDIVWLTTTTTKRFIPKQVGIG
jgi:hypothetical protein